MARTVTGESRVTVLPLLHTWPDRYLVLAYASTGAFGDTAAVGWIPTADDEAGPALMDIAIRHEPQRLYGSPAGRPEFAAACWLICTGWSGRGTPQPRTLDLRSVRWELRVDRTVELGQTMYGHDRLHVGRLTLLDEALMAKAAQVLPDYAAG
ncbi:hypothetical protein [Streptomyces sp. NPDC046887]|uniref:hypothetical protein n=1 Tax=Streptomyces sp. NPDC046887 TaxID=3155472 RepID=UPI0033E80D0D